MSFLATVLVLSWQLESWRDPYKVGRQGPGNTYKRLLTTTLFFHSTLTTITPTTRPAPKHLYSTPVLPANTQLPTMSLFKSNKNKTSSAASTPAQTPRPSVDAQRPSQVPKMTRDQALELALRKSVQVMPANFSLL